MIQAMQAKSILQKFHSLDMENIRELSDKGINQYYKEKDADYISTSVPHFRASMLPFASQYNEKDVVTHPSFLNNLDYEGEKKNNPFNTGLHCIRKIVFSVLNVPSHPLIESSLSDKRNFMRGEIGEIRELEHVERGLNENQTVIFQKDLLSKPPDELKIESDNPYGLPVTGRCDGLVMENNALNYIVELKMPRYMNWTWKVEKRPRYLGDKQADSPINSKPQIEHVLQLAWYKYKKQSPNPDNLYYVYDSGSEFALFALDFVYKDDKIYSIDVKNIYDEKVYRFLWARLETGLKNATKIVNDIKPNLIDSQDIHGLLTSIECLPAKKFKDITCLDYPCQKSGYHCGYLPYCYPKVFESGYVYFDKKENAYRDPLTEWQDKLREVQIGNTTETGKSESKSNRVKEQS